MRHNFWVVMFAIVLSCGNLFPIALNAQLVYEPEIGEARMVGIMDVEGVDKETLYERARVWISQNLKSGDENTFLNDESNGTLVATNNLRLKNKNLGIFTEKDRVLNHKITIECKDGKYRYIISNVVFSYWSVGGNNAPQWYTSDMNDTYRHVYEQNQKRLEKGKTEKEKHKELVEYDNAFIELISKLERAMRGGTNENTDDW